MKRYALVYQCGIANVFEVASYSSDPARRRARRLLQHAYLPCVWFARGLAEAGARVETFHCEVAGDCAHGAWQFRKGNIFANSRTTITNRPNTVQVKEASHAAL